MSDELIHFAAGALAGGCVVVVLALMGVPGYLPMLSGLPAAVIVWTYFSLDEPEVIADVE